MTYEGKHLARRRRARAMARRRAAITKLSLLLVALAVVTCTIFSVRSAGSAIRAAADKADTAAADNTGYVEAARPEVVVLKLVETIPETERLEVVEPMEDDLEPPEPEKTEDALLEQGYFRDDVPLSYELQDYLHKACEEAEIPYALALAVIQKETQFRNIVGDDGASEGYMQVQERWHKERMEQLGVTDLMDPYGNFRVGCNFLAELLDQYESMDTAVTVYNWGHNPGRITQYGREVMDYYEQWRGLVGDD